MESILEIIRIFFEVTAYAVADAVSFIYHYFKKPINFIILFFVLAAASSEFLTHRNTMPLGR